jgi:hypothetical protein
MALVVLPVYLMINFPTQLSRALTADSTETAEEFAVRFMETLTRQPDQAEITTMLCPDSWIAGQATVDLGIPLTMIETDHAFRVVRSIVLPSQPDGRPGYKVWVTFRYRYGEQGHSQTFDPSNGLAIHVIDGGHSYCVSPQPGQNANGSVLTKN